MEALNLPLRAIEEKYTLSEIALMSWRSREQGYQMRKKTNLPPRENKDNKQQVASESHGDKRIENLESFFDKLKKPVETDSGDFTLKNQTGEDAARVLSMIGFPVSPIGR
jgi:hypothetical protein